MILATATSETYDVEDTPNTGAADSNSVWGMNVCLSLCAVEEVFVLPSKESRCLAESKVLRNLYENGVQCWNVGMQPKNEARITQTRRPVIMTIILVTAKMLLVI